VMPEVLKIEQGPTGLIEPSDNIGGAHLAMARVCCRRF
jgi:hypothetical protein